MIHLETPETKVLPLQLRDLEDFLPEVTVPMVSLLATSGLVDPPIWAKLEMPVRPLLIWLLLEPREFIPSSVLADADPLGVNQNVTFEEVGGLDDRKLIV
jgi:hypothetical protein